MAPSVGSTSDEQPPPESPAGRAADDQDHAAHIHALMAEADALFKQKRYREAIEACEELAEADPSAFMPDQMIEACERELRRRRTIILGGLAAIALTVLAATALYRHLNRIRILPQPATTIRLNEMGQQDFEVRSGLGTHRRLEYDWRVLDADGKSTGEGRGPEEDVTSPWQYTYQPSYAVAQAENGSQPTVRRLVLQAVDEAGKVVVRHQWTIEVANVPRPPEITQNPASHPPPRVIIPGGRTFTISGKDGDLGTDLTYQWFLDRKRVPEAATASWTYRPGEDMLQAIKASPTGRVERTVECRVANRFGEPYTAIATWRLRVYPPKRK